MITYTVSQLNARIRANLKVITAISGSKAKSAI